MRLSTRLTIAMVALVLLTATAVSLLTYRNVVAIALPRGLDRIDTHARVLATVLEAAVRNARADVIGFRASVAVNNIMMTHLRGDIDPAASAIEAEWRRRLALRFVAELTGKLDYAQFRLIGVANGGRELVRVDHSGPDGAIRVVPDAELQRKGDRDYFEAAIALPAEDIYVSPVDLNKEQGVFETPYVPTLRTAAPIYTPDGKAFGIVIINVDLRPAFARIRSDMHGGSQLYVVNERGDYLLHPDASREFGFEFGRSERLQNDFPVFADLLAKGNTTPRVMVDRAGLRFGVGWESVRLAGGPWVSVVETMPYTQVIAAATAVRDSSLLGGLAAVLCALVLAVALARSLTRPLVQMTKAVEGFSDDTAIAMPSSGGREISVLAGAFGNMAAESQAKTSALKQEIEERRRIFDTSPDLILLTDRHGTFTRVSPSCQAILGYRPEEMAGHSATQFIHPDDLEPTRNEMRLARRGQVIRNFETRYLHKDGRIVTLDWSGVWSEPTQQYFFAGRDTTGQKLAEEKFRLAVEASPSGLVMIDGSGAIVLINSETERLFGYERDELIGRPVDILVPPRLRGPHVQHRLGFAAGPEARRMGAGRDLYGFRKDGTEFPVEIGLNPIHTPEGLLVLSVIVDISERKQAEASIRQYAEREQLFIAAVESSNDAIVTKTLDGVITGWNEAAERLFGYTSQEAIGQRIDIIVPEELRDEVRAILSKVKSGKKVDHHETVRINKNGQRIDVSLSISPVMSQSGVVIGAAKVARDISAKKMAEEALRESEQMARVIIDTALDAFLQLDKSGTVIGWSPKAEEMFGWSRQEIVGQKLGDFLIAPENREAYAERIAQFIRGAENGVLGRRYEAPSLRRDGRLINTEVSLTALWRRDGYIINGFIRDVTERVAAEVHLRQSQKMETVGQLTGGIAHDFNNMLAVITGTIDILADAVADKPDLAAIAKLISEAADRGAELTAHLLAFARKQPLQPREIDVSALMVESGKLLRPALGEHIEIETILKSGVWPALVDPNQFSSALLNLAINARDAMPNGGKLTLETSNAVLDRSYAEINADVQPGEYVLIAVSDTGDGIPEAIRDKIFEPFFTTKGIGKGTGLGLSMVYGLVKQSGGHIKVYSEEGYGTTFKIYLPRAGEQAKAITAPSSDPQVEGGDETILVVEDDPFVRTSATTQLHSLGYKTLPAANAAEALAIADGGAQFDLLFTDVIMPGKMNGRQLAEEMAKRRTPLKVLFTSGYTENAIIHHGRLDSGVLLLAKPYRKPELARMLRRALDAPNALLARDAEPLKSQAISTMSGSTDHNSEKPCIQSAFVLDDDPRIGAVVCKVLEAAGVAPRQFTNPGPFLTELQESPPDIVFLDLSLGQSDAIEVIRHLESNKYKGKLLLISGRDETTLNEITQIGEKRGLAMLPPLKKPFRPADIKQRLSSNAMELEHRKVQESQHDSVAPKIVVPLLEALGNNWLELWYQPKVDLKSFSVCGAEGLVRARHPVHGIIEPVRLLPPAGDPVYWPLSRFVVQRAMADWDSFARQGLHPILSVNAPVSVINMPEFIELIRSALPSDPAFPGLIVEVTEDEVIDDSAWVREIANQLKLYNVGISIDDFGSASASLSRLNDLPFTEVKIDRSFVSGCSSNHLKHSVCQTVIDLAHRFGATVCAEGAETVEDLGALIAMQCDSVQGYVFARPMPAAEFASFVLGGSFESIKSLLQTPDGRGPRLAQSP